MEYGDKTFKDEKLFLYQGIDPANANMANMLLWPGPKGAVNQRDADLLFMWKRVNPSYSFILPIIILTVPLKELQWYRFADSIKKMDAIPSNIHGIYHAK